MPDSTTPSRSLPAERAPDPRTQLVRARQKVSVYFAMSLLLLCAIAVIALPLPKVPLAFRVLAAAGDLIVAAVLWLVVRQKFDGK